MMHDHIYGLGLQYVEDILRSCHAVIPGPGGSLAGRYSNGVTANDLDLD